MNIPRKLKPCIECQSPSYIFSHGRCRYCAQLHAVTEKKEKQVILAQTEDGLEAKPFKYQTTAIKKVSTRQQKLNAAYKVLRDQFMAKHTVCMAKLEGCTHKATECHHSRGRGEYLLDDRTYKALCHSCHAYLETHPELSRRLGFTLNRLDKII